VNLLVTLCARGGSKGLADKNLAPVGGRPLIAWSIEQARRWGKARRIVCSTDSDAIAQAALAAGAEVPFRRPPELAGDAVGKVPVIRHALQEAERDGISYDAVVDLDVTSPLRTPADIDACVEEWRRSGAEVVFTVVRARKSPYFNMIERRKDGAWGLVKAPEAPTLRRQDAPEVFELNASIYVYEARALAAARYPGVLQARFAVREMPEDSAFDIDSEVGLEVVRALMRRRGWIE
jgi:N-acylneuraminate cytidylyltransferase/CMP-N,N'-diacetyllegionaminic acid synthase